MYVYVYSVINGAVFHKEIVWSLLNLGGTTVAAESAKGYLNRSEKQYYFISCKNMMLLNLAY